MQERAFLFHHWSICVTSVKQSKTQSLQKECLRKPEHNYVQIDLSDFAQILQAGLLWGVYRHS